MREQSERKNLTWSDRLAFASVGVFITLYGYAQELRGKSVYTTWLAQDITARFVMFIGVLFIAAAIFPWSRVRFLWKTSREKRRLKP
jgi:hypothetical protein